jgi:hypothetical protein
MLPMKYLVFTIIVAYILLSCFLSAAVIYVRLQDQSWAMAGLAGLVANGLVFFLCLGIILLILTLVSRRMLQDRGISCKHVERMLGIAMGVPFLTLVGFQIFDHFFF